MIGLRRGDERSVRADGVDGHGRARRDERALRRNSQRHTDGVSPAEHERNGRLPHARDQLGDGKPRLHIAAAGVEEQQHAVDLLALVERREQRQNVLVLGRFHGIGQKAVALDLPDDRQAVDRAARGARGHGSHIHDGLHGRRLLGRRPLLLVLVRLCRFRHGASLLFSHKVGFAEK